MDDKSKKLQFDEQAIRYHLEKIESLVPKAKLTLFIRHPHLGDGDILFSCDDHKTMKERLVKFVDEKILRLKK